MDKLIIQTLEMKNWSRVKKIYLEGIKTGLATFESEAPTWEAWDQGHFKTLRYIAIMKEEIAGWVALSPVSSRCVYGGVGEISIYIGEAFRKKT